MPIRALCTICSDFFDHSRDVAAIHCGHTFHMQCSTNNQIDVCQPLRVFVICLRVWIVSNQKHLIAKIP